MKVNGTMSRRMGRYFLLALATLAFPLLLSHKSEFPLFLNRYSLSYALLLMLYAINLALFWFGSCDRGSNRELLKRFQSGRGFASLVIFVLALVFLLDLTVGLPDAPSDWMNVSLLGCILVQAEWLRRSPNLISTYLALVAFSSVMGVIILELAFNSMLVQSRIPKSQNELARLMSAHGLWHEAISVTKPPNIFRILGLSDSFGESGKTSSNYHYLLEDMLRRNGTREVQMVNVSVAGYESGHELAMLQIAMGYSPDLVIHGFFVGNDFTSRADKLYQYGRFSIKRKEEASPYRPRNFLIHNWIVNVIKYYADRRQRNAEQMDGIVSQVGTFSKKTFLELQYRRTISWGKRTQQDDDRRKKVFPVLDAIRKTAERGGARYVMVIHPDQTQVDENLRREIVRRFRVNEDEYDYELPQKLLASYCEHKGIACLDLLPVFRAQGRNGELYLLRDTHYNEAGNRLAAGAIARFLKRHKVLPGMAIEEPEKKEARLQ